MMDIINFMKAAFLSQQVAEGEYYFLNLRPAKATPGAVVCGGLERCDPSYRIVRRRFRYHSVEYVASGAGEFVAGGRRHPLRPGSIFYYGPKTRHEIATDPARPMTKYFVDFSGPRFTRLLEGHPLAGHAPCGVAAASGVAELFAALQRAGRGGGPRCQGLCDCLLELLLLQSAEHAQPADVGESAAQQTYQRCRSLIEERHLALRSLSDVARACHVNATYLCRLFKRFGGETPYQMLVRLRLRRAVDQLSGPQALIKQAAKEAGFADPYHFSRVFKKYYGVSPRAFLANARRGEDA